MTNSLEAAVANAIMDRIEAIEVLPIERNSATRRFEVDADEVSQRGVVINVAPISTTYGDEENFRSAEVRRERSDWYWTVLVGFNALVDLTSFEDEASIVFLIEPDATESFPPFRVELQSSERQEPGPSDSDTGSVVELRYNVRPRRA